MKKNSPLQNAFTLWVGIIFFAAFIDDFVLFVENFT